jgi:hypothetical protein
MDDRAHDHSNQPELSSSDAPVPEPEPNPPPEQPAPRRRRKRPNGRWTDPATPLQAARFERRLNGLDVIKAIRVLCPGHGGEACKIDVAKLSDYETGNRRLGVTHIEAFCRFYQRSPEALGLINWRDEPPPHDPDTTTQPRERDSGHTQLVFVWVRDRLDSATAATAAQLLNVLSQLTTNDDAPEDNPGDTTEATD